MEISIERGIEMPGSRVVKRYPFEGMEVGDSFYVEGVGMQVLLNANWRAGKRLGRKYVARKEGGGIRVWRAE
jgi:hypothetical protein